MIYKEITKEWMLARVGKQKLKANLLTTLKGEIDMVAKNAQREVTAEDCVAKIKAFIKGNIESGVQLLNAGREIPDSLKEEKVILEAFLPKQFSEDELVLAIADAIIYTQAVSIKDMGKVMNALKMKHDGKYDGKAASSNVKEMLTIK